MGFSFQNLTAVEALFEFQHLVFSDQAPARMFAVFCQPLTPSPHSPAKGPVENVSLGRMETQQLDVISPFQSLLQQGSSHLSGAFVGQGLSRTALVLHPRSVRQGDDHTRSVDAKLHVHGVAVAQRDGRLQIDELAVVILLCQARSSLKIAVVHAVV